MVSLLQNMIKENDIVKTLIEKDDYPAGTIGVVVSLYSPGPACEVELWDEDNCPVDVVTYEAGELECCNR